MASRRSNMSPRAVLAATSGNVLEWYDFTVYGFLAPTLGRIFFPSDDHVASLLAAFAVLAEGFPRRPIGGTGIGRAIVIAVDLILRNRYEAIRRVIDISGDGKETTTRDWSIVPHLARVKAERYGVTINGLAILSDDPDLEVYYRRNVISGSGAFVVSAANFEDFSSAMRRKLVREIRYRPKLSLRPRAGRPSRQ